MRAVCGSIMIVYNNISKSLRSDYKSQMHKIARRPEVKESARLRKYAEMLQDSLIGKERRESGRKWTVARLVAVAGFAAKTLLTHTEMVPRSHCLQSCARHHAVPWQ